MERRRFTREFKLEAVRLPRDRGVAQASQDLNVLRHKLRNLVKAFADDPRGGLSRLGRMKPEQLEIARLKPVRCFGYLNIEPLKDQQMRGAITA